MCIDTQIETPQTPAGRPPPAAATPSGQATLTQPRRSGEAFRRDAPTLLCYGAIGVYAFWLYAYGPALALLQTELHFSYTVLGVYSALWSAGAALTGACFARLARRLPRAPLLWASAVGTVAGAALFAAARTVAADHARRRHPRLRRHDPAHLPPRPSCPTGTARAATAR